MITTPVEPGEGSVGGTGTPNCNLIEICKIGGGGTTPSMPPCTAPDTIIGMGPAGPSGQFNIPIAPPLAPNECIYVVDTCAQQISPVVCARLPAPAPTLSPRLLAVALGVLSLVALVGLTRLRRST